MIQFKKINFEDARGTIRDIFENSPKDHCTIITSTPGAVRANHFHKHTTQYSYIVSGKLTMATQPVDENGQPKGEVRIEELKVGDLAIHPPFEAHAFRSETDSIMLAFADGIRGGESYEMDVFRLAKPLL
jgi:mannose-6-phosphate isomerase-like protein (cupin superfamily)